MQSYHTTTGTTGTTASTASKPTGKQVRTKLTRLCTTRTTGSTPPTTPLPVPAYYRQRLTSAVLLALAPLLGQHYVARHWHHWQAPTMQQPY